MKVTLREVTPDDAPTLAHIMIAGNEIFRGIVPDKVLAFPEKESAKNWETTLRAGLVEGDFMFLAITAEDKPAGYSWGGLTSTQPDYPGELKQISVHPAYQKQGIGRLMVQEVAQRLAQQGIYSMCVRVLKINPNRQFYEHLGAIYESEYLYDWDGFKTTMCVYGWKDTSTLLNT